MTISAQTFDEYLAQVPDDRRETMARLQQTLSENLPSGFTAAINYNMPSFVVSHENYPPGYHCDPKLPLPFISFASQKNFIALYHMGIYAMPELLDWFTAEYAKRVKSKLDMGKSCIRFKKPSDIPFDLLAELFQKITPAQWIATYETLYKK